MTVERFGVGATGIEFQGVITQKDGSAQDISDATSQEWRFEPPGTSGLVSFTRAGSFVSDGTDGASKYLTVAGDFTVIGRWRRQLVVIGPGYVYPTEPIAFDVYANIP